jgi:hypothetical protein
MIAPGPGGGAIRTGPIAQSQRACADCPSTCGLRDQTSRPTRRQQMKSARQPPWAWATTLIQKDECRRQLRNPAAPGARSGPSRARRKLRNVSMQLFN